MSLVSPTTHRRSNSIRVDAGRLVWNFFDTSISPNIMNNRKDTSSTTKPVAKAKLRGITASVFENQTDKGQPFYKVTITRTYKDGDGFKNTSTFMRDDLPLVEAVAHRAWLEVMKLESADKL